MRLIGITAAALLLAAGEGRAQTATPPAPAYRFDQEPLMSVNRSYLGYSNLVDRPGTLRAPGYVTPYGQALNRGGYAYARPYNALARPRRGLFGRWRGR